MKLLMRCDHVIDVDVDKVPSPTCWCGERQVARALNPGRPRIVGHARGPLVEGAHLGPIALDFTQPGAQSLRLKPETQRKATDA